MTHGPARALLLALVLTGLAACSAAPPQAPAMAPPIQPALAPPPDPEPPPPPPPPPPKFAAHVASYKTMTEAEKDWPRLAARFPRIRDSERLYANIDLGGQRGKVVRLLLGRFVEKNQVVAYCHELRATGMYCAPHDRPVADNMAMPKGSTAH